MLNMPEALAGCLALTGLFIPVVSFAIICRLKHFDALEDNYKNKNLNLVIFSHALARKSGDPLRRMHLELAWIAVVHNVFSLLLFFAIPLTIEIAFFE